MTGPVRGRPGERGVSAWPPSGTSTPVTPSSTPTGVPGRGELDLVLERDDEIVFCEVKSRSSNRFGTAAEAVDQRKQSRIRGAGSAMAAIPRPARPAPFRRGHRPPAHEWKSSNPPSKEPGRSTPRTAPGPARPATAVPVPTQVGCPRRDDHVVPHTHGQHTIAVGTSVVLHSL